MKKLRIFWKILQVLIGINLLNKLKFVEVPSIIIATLCLSFCETVFSTGLLVASKYFILKAAVMTQSILQLRNFQRSRHFNKPPFYKHCHFTCHFVDTFSFSFHINLFDFQWQLYFRIQEGLTVTLWKNNTILDCSLLHMNCTLTICLL